MAKHNIRCKIKTKNILLVLFFIFIANKFIWSQNNPDSKKQNKDTINILENDGLIKNSGTKNPIIDQNELIDNKLYLNDPESVWLRTKLQLEYSVNNENLNNFNNILLPLREQYIESQKLNFVRYFLGITQTAAVGYLAYRHIKKYGFRK